MLHSSSGLLLSLATLVGHAHRVRHSRPQAPRTYLTTGQMSRCNLLRSCVIASAALSSPWTHELANASCAMPSRAHRLYQNKLGCMNCWTGTRTCLSRWLSMGARPAASMC
ncbi:hypothetical protein C8Q80DRAFT_301478 [Daedaleopsis nitida]|nr:hypothetical protein C8Q80DRAFT_301478 [Daedaleopsis nitida]